MPDISIKEVARLAKVSTATVSRSINSPEQVTEKTRLKVQAAIAKTGYSPNKLAQSFRRGRTNMVMVVLPSVGDPFFTAVMTGIRSAARNKGYSVVIEETQLNTMTADEIGRCWYPTRQTDSSCWPACPLWHGDSLSHRQTAPANRHWLRDRVAGIGGFSSVHIDNVAAAKEATDYLISQGHERIAMMYGQESSLLTKDRELGYRAAMQQANLSVDEDWVVEGRLSIPGARKATRSLLNNSNPPTAIFCANDEMAIGCLHEVKAAGLNVPDDVSIVGFDDIRYAEVTDPPLDDHQSAGRGNRRTGHVSALPTHRSG